DEALVEVGRLLPLVGVHPHDLVHAGDLPGALAAGLDDPFEGDAVAEVVLLDERGRHEGVVVALLQRGRDLTDEAELLVADQLQHSLEGLARMAAAVVVAVVAAVAAVFLATVALAAAALPAVATVVPVVVAGAVVAGAVVAGAVVPGAAPVLIRVGVVGRGLRPVRFLGRVGRHRIRGGDEFGFGLTVGAGAARGPLPGRLAFGSGLRCGRLGGVRGRLLR